MMQSAAVKSRTSGLSVRVKGQIILRSDSCRQTSSPQGCSSSRFVRRFSSNLQQGQTRSRTCIGTNSGDPPAFRNAAGITNKVCASRRTQSLTPLLASSLPSKKCRPFTSASSSSFHSSTPQHKQSSASPNKMSLKKDLVSEGDGKTYPKAGDTVTMEYTGKWQSSSGNVPHANTARLGVRRVEGEEQRQAVRSNDT